MVYLAELLVVMTGELKIVRIFTRNMPRTRTQALKRISRVYLAPGVACSMRQGAIMLKHKKIVSGQPTCACLTVASKQENCHDSMLSSL